MKRRSFLGALAGMGAAAWTQKGSAQIETNSEMTEEMKLALTDTVDSFPMLQRPVPGAMSVTWAVKHPATGWVEWGTTPELGQTARDSVGGLFPYEERFLSATMTGLEPGKTYYYRTVTRGVNFIRYGDLFIGEPEVGEIYSFQTPDANASTGSFAVINDTHENDPSLDAATALLDKLAPECVIWNGDLLNDVNSADQAVHGICQAGTTPWLSTRPVLLAAGNHDHRGPWARNLTKIFLPQNEFSEKYRTLIYNFAFRVGPMALIVLDTGEDKPDGHPIWEGLADFDRMRVLQAAWLEETLSRPEIASAPYVVAFCHIPLFDDRPNANPGDILDRWATWQRRCAELWSPILNKHDVRTLITAHQHRPADADPPSPERVWTQIHGGGANLDNDATVIHGAVEDGGLVVRRYFAKDGSPLGEWRFKPRERSAASNG